MSAVIQVHDLVKEFGTFTAVAGVTFLTVYRLAEGGGGTPANTERSG